ncbi:hypothetical protein [Nocardiopsis sp. NPDC006938]|uniref:hypothetical protein n=1 Tax=Nocardiopsis sp. NPDC006938 TaxID=3364337 RepID=UPI003679F62A
MGWITVGDGYTACVRGEGSGSTVVCRNPKGRELARVPTSLRADPGVVALRDLRTHLVGHEEEVLDLVRTWVLRSLPVPTALLAAVWPDPVWRRALRDVVVVPDEDGSGRGTPGLLRDAGDAGSIELLDLDGVPFRSSAVTVSLPHPVRLGTDLTGWRALADRDGSADASLQLGRAVWRRPDDLSPDARDVGLSTSFSYDYGATFERRVNRLRGRVRDERAHFRLYGADHRDGPIPLTLDLRWQGPEALVSVYDLAWHIEAGPVDDVAWSEGVNLLMELYRESSTARENHPGGAPRQVAGQPHRTRDRVPVASGAALGDRAELLRAEGVAPAPTLHGEDRLVALGQSHPALDHQVVALVPEHSVSGRLAAGGTMGLVRRFETEVGAARSRAPEFLAAVAAHHPDLVDRAVALLPLLRAQTEIANSKPGRARKALTAASDDLAATAPALRPLFLDECARLLAEAGNAVYATGFHDQARTAERDLGDVDEDAVVLAYARFPVPGALPRTLASHAKALGERLDPAQAYRRHRELVIAWCENHDRASKELATGWTALAQAAGIVPGSTGSDDPEADRRAVRALLANGSLALAPARTWTTLLPLLRTMVAEDPRVGRDLTLQVPAPSGGSARAKATAAALWARVLRETGVTEPFGDRSGITGGEVRAWANAFLGTYAGMAEPDAGVREPLRRAGKALRAAGLTADAAPLLSPVSWHEVQPLRSLDFVVSCGLPLSGHGFSETHEQLGLNPVFLYSWLPLGTGPLGLDALAADPEWRQHLRCAVEGTARFAHTAGFGRSKGSLIPEDARPHELQFRDRYARYAGALVRTPGVSDVVDDILQDHGGGMSEPGTPGLPTVYAAVHAAERFLEVDPPDWVVERAAPILAGVRPADSLAATLRGGVADELYLPALEELPEPAHSCRLEEGGPDLYLVNKGDAFGAGYTMRQVRTDRLGPVLATYSSTYLERRWCSVCLPALFAGDTTYERCTHERGEGPGESSEERFRFPGSEEITVRRAGLVHQEVVDDRGRVLAAFRIGRSASGGSMGVEAYCHRYAAGTGLVPPPGWWRSMSVRDEKGSAVLRAVDTDLAARLLASVPQDLGRRIVAATDAGEPRDSRTPDRPQCVAELDALVRAHLPGITADPLVAGVTALVWTAVECRERTAALRRRWGL